MVLLLRKKKIIFITYKLNTISMKKATHANNFNVLNEVIVFCIQIQVKINNSTKNGSVYYAFVEKVIE